jgi:hypothetical protein
VGEEEVGRRKIAKMKHFFASQDKTKAKIYPQKVTKGPRQVSRLALNGCGGYGKWNRHTLPASQNDVERIHG